MSIVKHLRLRQYTLNISRTRFYCKDTPPNDSISSPENEKTKDSDKPGKSKDKMTELLSSLAKNVSKETAGLNLAAPMRRVHMKKVLGKSYVADNKMREKIDEVADLFGGDKTATRMELSVAVSSHDSAKQSLSTLLSDMDVDRKQEEMLAPPTRNTNRDTNNSRRMMNVQQRGSYSGHEKIDLFGADSMHLFPEDLEQKVPTSILDNYDELAMRDLESSARQSPRNALEEYVQWTEQGKLWQFPIDNEFGLEHEKSYTFADHIFLQKHLHPWAPTKGPVKHFLDLVCVGLAKNPYITVERKIRHLQWYKTYFAEKEDVLRDVGAI